MATEMLMREYMNQSPLCQLALNRSDDSNGIILPKSEILFDYRCDHGNEHTEWRNTHYDTTQNF